MSLIFDEKVQIYRAPSGTMGRITISDKGNLKLVEKNKKVILKGHVRGFRFQNRGFNNAVYVRSREFAFSHPTYQLIFHNRPSDFTGNSGISRSRAKKKELLKALTSFGAYSGGIQNFLKWFTFCIVGIVVFAVLYAYYLPNF